MPGNATPSPKTTTVASASRHLIGSVPSPMLGWWRLQRQRDGSQQHRQAPQGFTAGRIGSGLVQPAGSRRATSAGFQ